MSVVSSKYSSPPRAQGVPSHIWIPVTVGSAEPYMYFVLSYAYVPMMKFSL